MELPFIEKYRPATLQQIVAQNNVTSLIDNFINNQRLPHLLLYGPPGTGKTSCAYAIAKRLYTPEQISYMTLELNTSDDRGIETVRENIKSFANTHSLVSNATKFIILDEIDSMTYDAQHALRRVIETYTYNCRFCLICNYVDKLIQPLISRCVVLQFKPLKSKQIFDFIDMIANTEGFIINNKEAIPRLCNYDMRKILNVLQLIKYTNNISNASIYTFIDKCDPYFVNILVDFIKRNSLTDSIYHFKKIENDIVAKTFDIFNCLIEFQMKIEKYKRFINGLAVLEKCFTKSINNKLKYYTLIAFIYKHFH